MPQRLFRKREVGFPGRAAGRDAGDPLVDERRRVRHRAHDPRVRREVALDEPGRDTRGHRQDHLLGSHSAGDLREHQ